MRLTNDSDRNRLLTVLSRHIGAANGCSVRQLARAVFGDAGDGPQRYVRQLIVELREAGEHVCAHPSTGYFIAETEDELDATCTYLYRRSMTSLQQIAAMKRVSLPDLAGQLNIRLEEPEA